MQSWFTFKPAAGRPPRSGLCRFVSALAVTVAMALCPLMVGGAEAPDSRPSLVMPHYCPHEPLFRRMLEDMADGWKPERTLVVQELSDRDMDRLVALSSESESEPPSTVDGCYTDKPDRADYLPIITLRIGLNDDDASLVFAHEYGHYLWNRLLTRTDRADYAKVWDLQKRRGRRLTPNSSESPEEGFAEAFALLQLNPTSLRKRDAQSWGFLDQLGHQLSRTAERRYTNR